jgi:hypothetical protein
MFFLLAFSASIFSASPSFAQVNGFSGSAHAASAAPFTGSVTPRTGPVAPPTGAAFIHNGPVTYNIGVARPPRVPHSPGTTHNGGNNHAHHTANGTAYYPYVYALPVPYAVDVADGDTSNDNGDDDDANYQGGPTVFDRRGAGAESYIPPSSDGPGNGVEVASAQAPEAADLTPQPPTTLVFKDGRRIEVGNYAIVSQTLYDLTPGHPRKIALGDLDLAATQKQNDDHGVVFQLPPSLQGN